MEACEYFSTECYKTRLFLLPKSGRSGAKVDKDPSAGGTQTEPDMDRATNWMAPSFNPEAKLVYVSAHQSYGLYFTDNSKTPKGEVALHSK
jgi:hypothetical protein